MPKRSILLGKGNSIEAGHYIPFKKSLQSTIAVINNRYHGTNIIKLSLATISYSCTVVVAQLVERSLPIPEVHGSNPVIRKNLYRTFTVNCIEKTKIKKKTPKMSLFKITS